MKIAALTPTPRRDAGFTLIEILAVILIIGVLNAMLIKAPAVPAWFSAAFGAPLWLPQALHIFPLGLVCLVLRLLVAPVVGLSL